MLEQKLRKLLVLGLLAEADERARVVGAVIRVRLQVRLEVHEHVCDLVVLFPRLEPVFQLQNHLLFVFAVCAGLWWMCCGCKKTAHMADGHDLLDVAKDGVDGLLRDDLVCAQRGLERLDVQLLGAVQTKGREKQPHHKGKKCLWLTVTSSSSVDKYVCSDESISCAALSRWLPRLRTVWVRAHQK